MAKEPRSPKQVRKLESLVRKLSDEEIKTFLVVLGALMAQVPAPKDARKSYLKEVDNRLRNNGVNFLTKTRSFPTFGLKLLGNDRKGFPIDGFKPAAGKIYPKLFAWYWAELDRLSKVSKPSKIDAQRAQRCLVVLSFAKMIKCSSVNQIKKALSDFEARVVEKSVEQSQDTLPEFTREEPASDGLGSVDVEEDKGEPLSTTFAASILEVLNVNIDLETLPSYLDLASLSTKPSALKDDPSFPDWFSTQFVGGIQREIFKQTQADQYEITEPAFGYKNPPFGRVHVLTEAAGKLRVILPYNTPFVHSTGLYARCVAINSATSGDYSRNQSKGHSFVQRENAKLNDKWNVSADLVAFSDNLKPEVSSFGLRSIGIPDVAGLVFNLPVLMPNGKTIIPKVLLMGLKGCFEFTTMLHHYVVRMARISNYAMCGDDLYYKGNLESIDRYIARIQDAGWSLNRQKTVISKTTAVFCGEMYWCGHEISPRVPKISSIYPGGRLTSAGIIFSVLRDAIANLNKIYSRRSVSRVISPLLHLLRSKWKGVILPELPAKLRGLGMRPCKPPKGLFKALRNKATLRCSLLSVGILQEDRSSNRWFGIPIELNPSGISQEFPDYPALLRRGAIQLDVPDKSNSAFKKDISSLTDLEVYEWYYDNIRLPRVSFM
jgi:hypothetical protein